jgi:hypothetical protein
MTTLLIGTEKGLFELPAGGEPRPLLSERSIAAFARTNGTIWAIADDRSLVRGDARGRWEEAAALPHEGACLLASGSEVLIGSEDAHVYRFSGEALERVAAFDRLTTRKTWYTPWGGPPAVRSLSGEGRTIYANVHVGGIVRSRDGGKTWEQTPLDIDDDVHQVLALGRRVLCAAAVGLGDSPDGGESWTIHTEGLHAAYCRALAVSGKTLFLSASQSHTGRRAALYRGPLDLSQPFERCREGLPEWFDDNIDTRCLAALRDLVAVGTTDGSVYRSGDGGMSWTEIASSLPAVRQIAFA